MDIRQYPDWETVIRNSQTQQHEINAVVQANEQRQEAERDARDDAEKAERFNTVLDWLGLPQAAKSDIVQFGNIRLEMATGSIQPERQRISFSIEVSVYERPQPDWAEEHDNFFNWYRELRQFSLTTDGWENIDHAAHQLSYRAELADVIDRTRQDYSSVYQQYLNWVARVEAQFSEDKATIQDTLSEIKTRMLVFPMLNAQDNNLSDLNKALLDGWTIAAEFAIPAVNTYEDNLTHPIYLVRITR